MFGEEGSREAFVTLSSLLSLPLDRDAQAELAPLSPTALRLRYAAAVELDSEHAIAQGIVKTARDRAIEVRPAQAFEAIPGKGVKATVDGREL